MFPKDYYDPDGFGAANVAYSGGDTFFVILRVLLIAAVAVGLFLLLRKLFLWYFKINTMVENQEKTNQMLADILKEIKNQNQKNQNQNPN